MLSIVAITIAFCGIAFLFNFLVNRWYVNFNRQGHVPGSRMLTVLAGLLAVMVLAFCEQLALPLASYPLAFAYMVISAIAGLIYGLVCGQAAGNKNKNPTSPPGKCT